MKEGAPNTSFRIKDGRQKGADARHKKKKEGGTFSKKKKK